MSLTVTLTYANGPCKGQQQVFTDPGRKVIGRGEDCQMRLPTCREFAFVSRHHCAVEIDQDSVRACDLGSRNGTFVNGTRLGPCADATWHAETQKEATECEGSNGWRNLQNGDELRLGDVYLRVQITAGS